MSRSEIQSFLLRLALIAAFLLVAWLIFQVREILGALLLALLTAAIISPLLDAQERRGIPPGLAITFVFLGAIFAIILGLLVVLPLLAEQAIRIEALVRGGVQTIASFAGNPTAILPSPVIRLLGQIGISLDMSQVSSLIREYGSGILGQLGGVVAQSGSAVFSWVFWLFGAVNNAILYIVFLLFALLERRQLFRSVSKMLPKTAHKGLDTRASEVSSMLLRWWRGQAILSFSIFAMTLVFLGILDIWFWVHVEHHVSLAIIAGICEFIPVIGPLVAMIPAVLIGSQWGMGDVTILVIAYITIQQIESLFLVPKVQGKALQLSDFEVLVWMTLAAALFGIMGILFTLPVLAATKIFFSGMGDEPRRTVVSAPSARK